MRFNKHKDYNLPTEYRQFEKANQQYHRRNRRASVSFGVFISYILVTILAAALWTEGFGLWKEDSVRPENPMEAEENGSNGSDNGENGNQTSDFVVRFLDVGQGAAVLITTEGKSMLIDGGGPKRSSFVVSYLKSLGITKLDSIIATHYDNDHISGLVGVLNVFGAEEVWGPDYETDTRTYRSFCRKLEEQGLTRKTPLPGDTMQLGEAVILFLAPEPGEQSNENDYSIAMKITYRDFSLVISGDATASSERKMLKLGVDLSCDIYYVAHHGSASSSSEAFLKAMKPGVAIISVGEDNTYGHPTEECLKRLHQIGASIYRTDEQGTICVTYGEENIQIGFDKNTQIGFDDGLDITVPVW